MQEYISTPRIDKKTAQFILACFDHFQLSKGQVKREDALRIIEAGNALKTFLREYTEDNRATLRTRLGGTSAMDCAKHVADKYSKLCDEHVDGWRNRVIV